MSPIDGIRTSTVTLGNGDEVVLPFLRATELDLFTHTHTHTHTHISILFQPKEIHLTENKTNERLLLSVTVVLLRKIQNHFGSKVFRPSNYWRFSLWLKSTSTRARNIYLYFLEVCHFRLLAIGVQTQLCHFTRYVILFSINTNLKNENIFFKFKLNNL